MADSFEKYMFKEHNAVYVDGMSEMATNINLLDILIKIDTRGFLRSRPVLTRAGSMTELGTASSQETQTMLREGLSAFEDTEAAGDEDSLFKWTGGFEEILKNFSSAKSLKGSLIAGPLAEAEVYFSCAKSLRCRLENLETSTVDKDTLVDIVTDKLWKPDIDNRRLQWSTQSKSGRKLWVIHQILYASKLVITSSASVAAGARALTAVPATPGAGLEASHESGPNSLVLTVGTKSKFPGKFMFAYRAICFEFDAAGELVDYEDNAGKALPVHRGAGDGPYDDEQEQIRDLFTVAPPKGGSDSDSEEDEEWDGHSLPIEENAD